MRESFFDQEFFASNRRRLRENLAEAEVIVVAAHGQLQKNADEFFRFRQDSTFWYLTGLDIADALLVIDVKGDTEYLVLPHWDDRRSQWETGFEAGQVRQTSGIATVYTFREGLAALKQTLQAVKTAHILPTPSRRFRNFYGIHPNPSKLIWHQRLKRINPALEFMSARDAIIQLRIIKQPPELQALRQAIDITHAAFADVQAKLPELKFEYQVRAELHAGFGRRGAEIGFDTIVAAGSHSALIHYEKSGGKIEPDDFLLIDMGAAVSYYNADISRTLEPVNGMSERQRAVYEAVERVKQFATELMKPGVKHREYEQQVSQLMGKELVKLGLLKRVSEAGIRRYFPHLTSHHLGLDVHDIAKYDETFEPGMVLTIEPGIYIPEEGIGVRIEDDVLITETGIEVLSE